jgi:hypothetical protein
LIPNVSEPVYLGLVLEQAKGDAVDRGITPALVEETTVLIQGLEEIDVSLAAQPLQTSNLEVGPLDYHVS